MALWGWLGETARELRAGGQSELAEGLVRLAQMAADGQADAAADAAPALARAVGAADAPDWAPALVEHLPLAARVGDRAEGEAALPAALARLGAVHTAENGGSGAARHRCGPAACAAETVLACYGNMDGPGYLADRAALIAESLTCTSPGE